MSRLLIATALAMIAWPTLSEAAPPPEIRVLLHQAPRAAIEGLGHPMTAHSGEGHVVNARKIGTSARIEAGPEGLIVNGEDAGGRTRISNSPRMYGIDERRFRGELELVWKGRESLIVVNRLPMEQYLVGLIGSEMYASWPVEAFKAQAVAARTYALHNRERPGRQSNSDFDIMSTVLSQVYDGAHKEAPLAREAVQATAGEVLMRRGSIFPSYYHSCCGGITEHAHNVWPGAEGPPQIEDRFCSGAPRSTWSAQIPFAEISQALAAVGIETGRITGIGTRPEMDSPRAKSVVIEHDGGVKSMRAAEFRQLMGYTRIRSTWFDVRVEGGKALFIGRGYGHGVGMCQWGAKGMADKGHGYRSILNFYYPDAQIVKIY